VIAAATARLMVDQAATKPLCVTDRIKVELGGKFLSVRCNVTKSVCRPNSGAQNASKYIIAVIVCFNGNGSLAEVPVETIHLWVLKAIGRLARNMAGCMKPHLQTEHLLDEYH
jgi:hypothetical protein